jgi:hypothetical protein
VISRLVDFRLRLLLKCSCLNADTVSFHPRTGGARSAICSICDSGQPEDAAHIIINCPALQDVRNYWLNIALPPTKNGDLLDWVLGVSWKDDHTLQVKITRYASELRSARACLLLLIN